MTPGEAPVPVAVIGAGPVGLTLAGRLAQYGVRVRLFEAQPHQLEEGSKALCMQRETLEIWARLGIGEQVARRGVQWRTGRTYHRGRELFSIELPGATNDHFPPFVNISQTEVDAALARRLTELPNVELCWGHRLTSLAQDPDGVDLTFETDAGGAGTTRAAYVVGTDGAHSTVRHALGLEFEGHSFDDLFLIADVRADLPYPAERRFFFDPPANPGRQVLIHPQPDGVWRIDWQVPSETDVDAERRTGGMDRRIRAVIGPGVDYELVWLTAYRFSQRLVDRFRAGRVFLAGDAAHLMSPFGARGLNSGVADAENLAWKLALVLAGRVPDALLDSYDAERRPAALENLAVTEATMRFMVPHGWWRRLLRALLLRGSTWLPALRRHVNSGRLAQPFTYAPSAIVAPGPDDSRLPRHGSVAPDAPIDGGRLRDRLGTGFVLLLAGVPASMAEAVAELRLGVPATIVAADAPDYAAAGPRAWIIRPDGHIALSRPIRGPADVAALPTMLARASGRYQPLGEPTSKVLGSTPREAYAPPP